MTLTLEQSIDATRKRIQDYSSRRGLLNTKAGQKVIDTLDDLLPHQPASVIICYDVLCQIHNLMQVDDEITTPEELAESKQLIMNLRFSILNWLSERP